MNINNGILSADIDDNTGYITSISIFGDKHGMNFISEGGQLGCLNQKWRHFDQPFELLEIGRPCSDGGICNIYGNERFRVALKMGFSDRGALYMSYTFKNITYVPVCINRDTLGISIPFNDRYTYAAECLTRRCHTHIHCGGTSSWVNALRMGVSEHNLGLVLVDGAIVSYSQYDCKTNCRGVFELEPETVILEPNEEYRLGWEIFLHNGDNFFSKLREYESFIDIRAEHYTLFLGEAARFTLSSGLMGEPTVTVDGEKLPAVRVDNGYSVTFTPNAVGEYRVEVEWAGKRTFSELMVKSEFGKLTEKRVFDFVKNQQYLDPKSQLYGAFLIRDNKLGAPYFDYQFTDHNACRERLNMAFVLIKYLQKHRDDTLMASFELFIRFMFREFYDEESGDVYNNIGKNHDFLRLYNAPGVMLLFAEAYLLTRDERYIDNIVRLADKYYSIGGEKCYSNAVAIKKVMGVFRISGRDEDGKRVLGYFKKHVDNMIANGLDYPKHEVNYEQTIVTAAVICISEFGRFSDDKAYYIAEARKHIACLERFSGAQPTFHKNQIAIRFWDDYWFGGKGRFGDTLPHHLSCLTARAYVAFYELSGERIWLTRAEECIRNCLCLIGENGKGSAAYVLPHTVNGEEGEFYDHWANDQDLSLYDGMYLAEYSDSFKY